MSTIAREADEVKVTSFGATPGTHQASNEETKLRVYVHVATMSWMPPSHDEYMPNVQIAHRECDNTRGG